MNDTMNYKSKGLSKPGAATGNTIASRAKATPTAAGLLDRDLAQSQFGSTTNFSSNF